MPEIVSFSIEECPDPDHGIHFVAQVPWEEEVYPVVGSLDDDGGLVVDEDMTASILVELMMVQEAQALEEEQSDFEYDWGGYL